MMHIWTVLVACFCFYRETIYVCVNEILNIFAGRKLEYLYTIETKIGKRLQNVSLTWFPWKLFSLTIFLWNDFLCKGFSLLILINVRYSRLLFPLIIPLHYTLAKAFFASFPTINSTENFCNCLLKKLGWNKRWVLDDSNHGSPL